MILSAEIDGAIEREIYRLEVEIECDSCPDTIEPVCASNGKTYGNICELMCDGEIFSHIGNCLLETIDDKKEEAPWVSRRKLVGVNEQGGVGKVISVQKLSKRAKILPIEFGRFK